jgi:hypothetical protein
MTLERVTILGDPHEAPALARCVPRLLVYPETPPRCPQNVVIFDEIEGLLKLLLANSPGSPRIISNG